MDLKAIRTQFVNHTGRFDLVVDTTDYVDNGADFFIQSGQRFLDTLLPTPKSPATFEITLTVSDFSVVVPDIRSIWNVYIVVEDKPIELNRWTLPLLRQKYSIIGTFAELEDERPVDFALSILREVGGTIDAVAEGDLGIIIAPPPNLEYSLFVEGLFYSRKLTGDTDQNAWSIRHPETLIQAAMYSLERFYRNTQGMRDHLEAIQNDVRGIDFDVAEERSELTDSMRASFDDLVTRPRRYYDR